MGFAGTPANGFRKTIITTAGESACRFVVKLDVRNGGSLSVKNSGGCATSGGTNDCNYGINSDGEQALSESVI